MRLLAVGELSRDLCGAESGSELPMRRGGNEQGALDWDFKLFSTGNDMTVCYDYDRRVMLRWESHAQCVMLRQEGDVSERYCRYDDFPAECGIHAELVWR